MLSILRRGASIKDVREECEFLGPLSLCLSAHLRVNIGNVRKKFEFSDPHPSLALDVFYGRPLGFVFRGAIEESRAKLRQFLI